ncbi:hypothetical protein IV38_GL001313 [Lactobacillus selangorensis]|uniref:Uncharacterized protein n=1 Tax=Lactobacillus selangorensis TaxID=81857 RepID=A0A0R2FKS7_9LACO|nr:hypothetical protein [Lactobacillus selangorensis]KRN28315.1 hypothetical protein IV38_GL001313 [Lactobacillus selangorensis]KRN31817.1 hypothetical protein IV40_GL001100 [Lactobacillus selangorensis]
MIAMANRDKLEQFAEKWLAKFQAEQPDYIELVDHYLADDCQALGFEMDSGKAFCKQYGNGNAYADPDELDLIIATITDVNLLGVALYSRWRYFNHWAYSAKEIIRPENRQWFVLILTRMLQLAQGETVRFSGRATGMRLISQQGTFLEPQATDEIRQTLTFFGWGPVFLDTKTYNGELNRDLQLQFSKAVTDRLLASIAEYFRSDHQTLAVTDAGTWQLQLTNSEGKEFCYTGPLCDDLSVDGTGLSDLLRTTLKLPFLWAFDGQTTGQRIMRIEMHYHSDPEEETFQIDRQTGRLALTQHFDDQTQRSQTIQAASAVVRLLDQLDPAVLFTQLDQQPQVIAPNEERHYALTITFDDCSQRIVSGNFDKAGLPTDWPAFAAAIQKLVADLGQPALFDSAVYTQATRQPGQFIYCSVALNHGPKTYFYRTEDNSIVVNDRVIVPVGPEDTLLKGRVTKVAYYDPMQVPLPIAKTKRILRKVDD